MIANIPMGASAGPREAPDDAKAKDWGSRQIRLYHRFLLSTVFVSLCVSLLAIFWIIPSSFEARTFTRLTGREVSTWDAMWVELRVIEPVNPVDPD